jgi:hypothetical protein
LRDYALLPKILLLSPGNMTAVVGAALSVLGWLSEKQRLWDVTITDLGVRT